MARPRLRTSDHESAFAWDGAAKRIGGDFNSAGLPLDIDDSTVSSEDVVTLGDLVECEPEFTFMLRRRFARTRSAADRQTSLEYGANYEGRREGTTLTWKNFPSEWWLTGLPAFEWDLDSSSEWVGYRGHLLRRTGYFWMNEAQRREVMLAIDALHLMENWIAGYWMQGGTSGPGRVYPIGDAFNEVLRDYTTCVGVWNTTDAFEAVGDGEVADDVAEAIESSPENSVFAAYDLNKVRAGVKYTKTAREMIMDRLQPPDSARWAIMVDRSAWIRGRSGEIDVGVEQWKVNMPSGCFPSSNFAPDGQTGTFGGNVKWLLPRVNSRTARIIMQAPNQATARAAIEKERFLKFPAESPLTKWVEFLGGFAHETFHNAFSLCGLSSSQDPCQGSNAIDAAESGEWTGTNHFFCMVAGMEVAEKFVFGEPNGRFVDDTCALRDFEDGTHVYDQ